MDLFELNGRVVVNLADALKAFDEIQNEGQKTESKLSKVFSGIGKGAIAIGKTIGTSLVAAGGAMGALTVKALNLSGELEQNMGGSEAVFKEYAGKMQETAKSAFENMGLSTADFLGTANKMGALFQGAGFSIEESSDLASEAMQRAADVASIMGIDTESAMEAIAGAAKGNFTMMDNLGVAMNDTTLQAYALEKGITKSTTEMTNQEKIALAMEMFMEKTAYATGNYAKENETLAGSLGTAKSALTNFLDGSGDVDQLVSAFSNAADVIVKNVKEIAPRLVSGITDIVNQLIPEIPPLLQELLPVIIDGAVSLINGLVSALPTIIDALMSALPTLIEGVTQIINALIQALPQIMQSLVSALPTIIPMLIDALISVIVTLCNSFSQIIKPLIDALPDIIISIVDALMDNLPSLIEGVINLVMGLVEALPQIIQALVDAIPITTEMVVTALLENLPMLINGATDLVIGLVTSLPTILSSLTQALPNAFRGIWKGVQNVFSNAGDWFGMIFGNAKDTIVKLWNGLKDYYKNLWQGIKDVFSSVGKFFDEIFRSAVNKIKDIFSGLTTFFSKDFWGKIKTSFSELGTKISDSISSAVKKGINGVIGGAENIVNGFFKLVNGAIDMINEIPGVNITKISMVEFTRLAKGGVVDKPTPAVFGEDGAEAVVPLENNTGWIDKVATQLHAFTMQNQTDISGVFSTRMIDFQSQNLSEMRNLNGKVDAIIAIMERYFPEMVQAILTDKHIDLNKREFARLVKEVN